jgi:H+/Cl- antiporter ClcA
VTRPLVSPFHAEHQRRPLKTFFRDSPALLRFIARWLVIVVPLAIAIGSAIALFLWALALVTDTREHYPWLLFLLPLAGAAIGVSYGEWGKGSDRGNNLIIDEIHKPGAGVPARMAPFVLIATVVTHLFGGSAGREGTAVQIGGSFASAFERSVLTRLPKWFALDERSKMSLLQAGMAAGFGAVFGTPIAGAVFALEVLSVGELNHTALIPCALAALVGDWTVAAWGVHHQMYPQLSLAQMGYAHIDLLLFAKLAAASMFFGFASWLFAETVHGLGATFKKIIAIGWLRPVVGGLIVIVMTYALGTRDYLGLGVTSPNGGVSIVSSFTDGGAAPLSWLYKLIFTVVTLASGFKGGEVTPLFFIGATLGNVLAVVMHAPVALFAAAGFVGVFAGATNTPLACTLMGLELFGADAAAYIAVACFVAFLCSGQSGIYTSQLKGLSKTGRAPA